MLTEDTKGPLESIESLALIFAQTHTPLGEHRTLAGLNPWEYMRRFTTSQHPEVLKATQEEAVAGMRLAAWQEHLARQEQPDSLFYYFIFEARTGKLTLDERHGAPKKQTENKKQTEKNYKEAKLKLEQASQRREQIEQIYFGAPSTEEMLRGWREGLCYNYINWHYIKKIEDSNPGITKEESKTLYHKLTDNFAASMAWLRLLSAPKDPTQHHQAVARKILKKESEDGAVVDALARCLLEKLRLLSAAFETKTSIQVKDEQPTIGNSNTIISMRFGSTIDIKPVLNPEEEGSVLWCDALAFRFLRGIGKAGIDAAKSQEEKAKERWQKYSGLNRTTDQERAKAISESQLWRLWAQLSEEGKGLETEGLPPIRIFLILADAIWHDVIKPSLHRLKLVPTLPTTIAQEIIGTFGKRGAELSADYKSLFREGEVIAKIPTLPAVDLERLNGAARAIGSLDMARAIPWLVRKAWEQHGQPNDADVEVDGGLTGFGEKVLGIYNKDASSRARLVLDAGKHFERDWPGFTASGLWTYVHSRPTYKKEASLCITTSPMLRPHSQYSRKELGSWLVPILPPPPLVGRQNEHASQAFFANLFMLALVEHRSELLDGGALIKPKDLERLAEKVGLPKPTLYKALEHWRQDQLDGPAFLEIEGKPEKGARYMLADNDLYRLARVFLLEGAERSKNATQAAQKSLTRRNALISGKVRRKSK